MPSSSVSKKTFPVEGDASLTAPKTQKSGGYLCGLVVSVFSAISNLIRKIASIFCCCVKTSKENGAESVCKKIGEAIDVKKALDAFKKACKEGDIEAATKLFEPLGFDPIDSKAVSSPCKTMSFKNSEGDLIVVDPREVGLIAIISGDPSTKTNRLELARQMLNRCPAFLAEKQNSDFLRTAVHSAMVSEDYKDFIPLLVGRGLDLKASITPFYPENSKTIVHSLFLFLVVVAVESKDSERLEWLLTLGGIDPKTKNYLSMKGYTSEFLERFMSNL